MFLNWGRTYFILLDLLDSEKPTSRDIFKNIQTPILENLNTNGLEFHFTTLTWACPNNKLFQTLRALFNCTKGLKWAIL